MSNGQGHFFMRMLTYLYLILLLISFAISKIACFNKNGVFWKNGQFWKSGLNQRDRWSTLAVIYAWVLGSDGFFPTWV